MEALQAKHRKEQRDLQSQITQKKKSTTKKTRKGVNDECDTLQREFEERQRVEIENLVSGSITTHVRSLDDGNDLTENARPGQPEIESSAEEVTKSTPCNGANSAAVTSPQQQQQSQLQTKKPNRQKARLARRAAEQEAQAAQATEEAANLPDLRQQELAGMRKHCERLDLAEISIRPDGHCLYSAVATQLPATLLHENSTESLKSSMPHHKVRFTASNFIAENPNDFSAFLEEPLDVYVAKIKDTAEWGGQLELQAIARAYKVGINVLQADGRIEKMGPDSSASDPPAIWLAYYRHSFGLGEHYNALKKIC